MKRRQGFVSNSSSSSFIVIADGNNLRHVNEFTGKQLTLGDSKRAMGGESEFGWDHYVYYDTWSKINFAYLQTESINPGENKLDQRSTEWLTMLEQCIKEVTGATSIVWDWNTVQYGDDSSPKWKCAYIDHQSAACEGMNTEMFESMDALKRFLFDANSYIETDNDNR